MNKYGPLAIGVVLLAIISVIARFSSIDLYLPYYSLDENELTEYALMLFGPDKDPHWYKYGPLYWYWLHWIYEIQASMSGLSDDQFVQRYFIEPKDYFLTSRCLGASLHIGIAAIASLFAFKRFGNIAGWITIGLAFFPFSDMLTAFLPRTDTLLGFCVICCLFFGSYLIDGEAKRPVRYFALMGVFFALSISAKPIPSLLIAPSLFLIFWIYHMGGVIDWSRAAGALGRIFTHKYLYVFLGSVLVAFYISNPYAFKSFSLFWAEQVQAVQSEGDRGFRSGADLLRFSGNLGYVYIVCAVLATLWSLFDGLRNKKTIPLVLGSYAAVYWGMFAMGAARDYFYVPLVPVWSLLIAYYTVEIMRFRSIRPRLQELIAIGLVLFIIAQPLSSRVWPRLTSDATVDTHTQHMATQWIYDNVPGQSSILYYGYYTSLPNLMDLNLNEQAQYSDHFMYGRGQNQYWVDRFVSGHQGYYGSGSAKTYDITYNLNVGGERPYYTRYENENVSSKLFGYAARQGAQYICSSYPITDNSNLFVLVKTFDGGNASVGPKIWIYAKR